MINIDNLISEATKNKSLALPIYRLIKAEFLRWQKDNPGKEFNASVQNKILKKMHDQRMESKKLYEEAGRAELAEAEITEAKYIAEFLPEEVSDEEIEMQTKCIILSNFDSKVTMKDMKTILAMVQEKYPGASGKVVSQVVKTFCK